MYNMGIHIPIAPRHSILVEAGRRQFYETLRRTQIVKDLSTFIADGKDITSEVPNARDTFVDEIKFFNDLEFYKSDEFSLGYTYYRIHPTADMEISPRGTAALFRYRHIRAAVADSLVEQVQLYIPIGVYSDGSFAISSYQPDQLLDEYRPYRKNLDVNEYMAFLQHFHHLPYLRHVLGGTVLIGYKDIVLKDVYKNEGSGYDWPLKYYLGGRILSGYPYFSFWGTKLFYSRFDCVFPIRYTIAKDILGVHFQRLYGAAFFEAAQVWNFHRLSLANLKEGSMKRDIGFELRLKTVMFYRLSTFLNARIVWPLDDMDDSPYKDQRDARRYYIELRM